MGPMRRDRFRAISGSGRVLHAGYRSTRRWRSDLTAAHLTAPAYARRMAFSRITIDPAQMGGRPCIRGLRVTVGMILGQLVAGRTVEDVLEDYPYLERDDVLAALDYAAAMADERELPVSRPA